ncbi:hypothetical protein [Roseovarius sp.]|uniref:hypothetical protein n=1 Tax=Roseovarius sp. TaxID=1486281 RepID=UPI0026291913|nr:hypothetical protein [Roseovarius sp.]
MFMLKAHEWWAFGFGRRQNIRPASSEQAKPPLGEQISGRVGVSPPVTTSDQGGDRKSRLKTTLSPLSPLSPPNSFLRVRKSAYEVKHTSIQEGKEFGRSGGDSGDTIELKGFFPSPPRVQGGDRSEVVTARQRPVISGHSIELLDLLSGNSN